MICCMTNSKYILNKHNKQGHKVVNFNYFTFYTFKNVTSSSDAKC